MSRTARPGWTDVLERITSRRSRAGAIADTLESRAPWTDVGVAMKADGWVDGSTTESSTGARPCQAGLDRWLVAHHSRRAIDHLLALARLGGSGGEGAAGLVPYSGYLDDWTAGLLRSAELALDQSDMKGGRKKEEPSA